MTESKAVDLLESVAERAEVSALHQRRSEAAAKAGRKPGAIGYLERSVAVLQGVVADLERIAEVEHPHRTRTAQLLISYRADLLEREEHITVLRRLSGRALREGAALQGSKGVR